MAAPGLQWEVEGGNASIHHVHNEFMGVAGILVGANGPGLGAQVNVTTNGTGHLSGCTVTNAGTGYNRTGTLTGLTVYSSSSSNGSVNIVFSGGSIMAGGCTVNNAGSGYPTSDPGTGTLASIDDTLTTVGAQNLLTEDIEACCATGSGTADNIRIASGGTYSGVTLINTNEMSNAPTNVINDQNHAPIVGGTHGSVSLYMLNDAGNVAFDSTGTNPVAYPGFFNTGNMIARTSDYNNSSNSATPFLTITFPSAVATTYYFHCGGMWASTGTGSGIKISAVFSTAPTNASIAATATWSNSGSEGTLTNTAAISSGNNGTTNTGISGIGSITLVTTPTTPVNNVAYPFWIDGVAEMPSLLPSSSATLQFEAVNTTTSQGVRIFRDTFCK